MFMYERDGKLCIVFNDNKPADQPDVIIEKVDDKVLIHVGDTTIEGSTDSEE